MLMFHYGFFVDQALELKTLLPAPTNYRESEGNGGEDGRDEEAGADPVSLADPRN